MGYNPVMIFKGAVMKVIWMAVLSFLTLQAMEPAVSGKWLIEHQNDPHLVVVDVSPSTAYMTGHVPGAIRSGIEKWRRRKDAHAVEVKSVTDLQEEMRRLGIDANSSVVVYSHHLNNKDVLKATYVLWAMEYAGLKNTALLDGGLPAYEAADGNLSTAVAIDRYGSFTAEANRSVLATIEEVNASVGKTAMIDSRPADFYFGAVKQKTLARSGHISYATSYFWRYSLDADRKLKPLWMLSKMIEAGLGFDKTRPLIVYCTGGLEASMNYFVFHRLLGFDRARLYDASMKEWANRSDTPMTSYRWE